MNYNEIPENIHAMIEDKIYYLCFSRISRHKIPGFDGDDLAQELRIHIYRKLETHTLNTYKNPKGWIVTCMKRKLIDIYRKSQRSKDAYNRCDIMPFDNLNDNENGTLKIRPKIDPYESDDNR